MLFSLATVFYSRLMILMELEPESLGRTGIGTRKFLTIPKPTYNWCQGSPHTDTEHTVIYIFLKTQIL